MIGNGKSSFKQALFKSLKSTQTRICQFFFLIGMMFAIHVGYFTFLMKPASINLSIFVSICETGSRRNHLWACLIMQRHLYNQVTTENNFSLQKDLKAYLHRLALGPHLYLN